MPRLCGGRRGRGRGSDPLTIRRASTQEIVPGALAERRPDQAAVEPRAGLDVCERALPADYPPRIPRRARWSQTAITSTRIPTSATARRRCAEQLDVAGGATSSRPADCPGIEDLQVELGADFNADQNADYFVQPTPRFPPATGSSRSRMAARRAEQEETGYVDRHIYDYASRTGALSTRRRASTGSSSARRSRSGIHGNETTSPRQRGRTGRGARHRPHPAPRLTILAVSAYSRRRWSCHGPQHAEPGARFPGGRGRHRGCARESRLSTSAGIAGQPIATQFAETSTRTSSVCSTKRRRTGMTGYSFGGCSELPLRGRRDRKRSPQRRRPPHSTLLRVGPAATRRC